MRVRFMTQCAVWGVAVLVACAAGCTATLDEAPAPTPDPEPDCMDTASCEPEPMQPPVVIDNAVWTVRLGEERASGLFALGDGVLGQGADALFFQEERGVRPVAATQALAAPGERLRAVAALGEDTLILSTEATLWSLTPEGLTRSPIASHFVQAPPVALVADGGALWLLNAAGLYGWHGGELVRLERAQLGGDVLALVAAPGGQGVWASTRGKLHALRFDEAGQVKLATSPAARGAERLVRGRDEAWALSGGVVYRVGADGGWQALVMETKARALAANPGAQDLWVEDEGGRVWHFGGGQLVRLAQALRWGQAQVVDARGGLVVADEAGLVRHTRRLEAGLVEVPRAPISEPAPIKIAVAFPERVESIALTVGGVTLDVMVGADGVGEGVVEPAQVGAGRHGVSLVVRYKGGAEVRCADRLEVAPFDFTWSQHIKPLYEQSCARCHGTQSSRPLDTRERWVDNFDAIEGDSRRGIMNQVTQKIMPLPPTPSLEPQQLRMLQQWKDKGFLP